MAQAVSSLPGSILDLAKSILSIVSTIDDPTAVVQRAVTIASDAKYQSDAQLVLLQTVSEEAAVKFGASFIAMQNEPTTAIACVT